MDGVWLRRGVGAQVLSQAEILHVCATTWEWRSGEDGRRAPRLQVKGAGGLQGGVRYFGVSGSDGRPMYASASERTRNRAPKRRPDRGGAEPAHRVPSGNGCRFRLSLFAAGRVYGQLDHTYVIAASWKPCWLVSLLQSAGASGQEDGLEVGDGPFSIHQKSKGTTHFGRESTSWPLDSGRMKRRLHDFGGCRLASPVPSRAGSFHGSGFASRWHGLVDPGLQPVGC